MQTPQPMHFFVSRTILPFTSESALTERFLQYLMHCSQATQRFGSYCGSVMPMMPKSARRTFAQSFEQPVKATFTWRSFGKISFSIFCANAVVS